MHSYALLIAVAIALLAPATAPAVTTVSGSQGCDPPTYRGVQDCFALVTATGDGAASEVTATREPHALVVHDPFGVVAGERCAPVPGAGGSAVRCTFTLAGHPSLSVDGGPGDDRLLVPFAAAAGGPGDDIVEGSGRIEGGPGDDVLRGASSDDILGGGPGADAIDGGAGEDLADYRDHDTPVSVALGSDVAAGSAGEGDRLSGVEGVLGGSGDDVLRGGDGGDLLLGGPGDDELRGGDGDDRIVDVDGRDLLVGGAGDDYLLTTDDHSFRLISDVLPGRSEQGSREGRSILLGGEGEDFLRSGLGSDRLDPGPGRDTVLAYGGQDSVWLRDGEADDVECGRLARVRVDVRDLTQHCRHVERTGVVRPHDLGVSSRTHGGERATVGLGCSDDQRRGCRGLVRVFALGREVGRERFSVRPGRSDLVTIRLDRRVAREVARRGSLRAYYRVDTHDDRGDRVVLRRRQTICRAGIRC